MLTPSTQVYIEKQGQLFFEEITKFHRVFLQFLFLDKVGHERLLAPLSDYAGGQRKLDSNGVCYCQFYGNESAHFHTLANYLFIKFKGPWK